MRQFGTKALVAVVLMFTCVVFWCCNTLSNPKTVNTLELFCEAELCKVDEVSKQASELGLSCDVYARTVCSIGAVVAPFTANAIDAKTITPAALNKATQASLTALKAVKADMCKVQP